MKKLSFFDIIEKTHERGNSMEERRILIPKELLDRSNLKGANKIIFSLKNGRILLIPYQDEEDLEDIEFLGIRNIDYKGRVPIPVSLHVSPEELMPLLLNGEIWITRHI